MSTTSSTGGPSLALICLISAVLHVTAISSNYEPFSKENSEINKPRQRGAAVKSNSGYFTKENYETYPLKQRGAAEKSNSGYFTKENYVNSLLRQRGAAEKSNSRYFTKESYVNYPSRQRGAAGMSNSGYSTKENYETYPSILGGAAEVSNSLRFLSPQTKVDLIDSVFDKLLGTIDSVFDKLLGILRLYAKKSKIVDSKRKSKLMDSMRKLKEIESLKGFLGDMSPDYEQSTSTKDTSFRKGPSGHGGPWDVHIEDNSYRRKMKSDPSDRKSTPKTMDDRRTPNAPGGTQKTHMQHDFITLG